MNNTTSIILFLASIAYVYWVTIRLNDYNDKIEAHNNLYKKNEMTFAIVITETRKNDALIKRSIENKRKYAATHKYHFYVWDKEVTINDDPEWGTLKNGWLKPYAAIQAMKVYPEVDWIWWVDTDVVIMNFMISLDLILETVIPEKHIVVANKCDGVNSGSLFVRNTVQGRVYMERMIDVFLISQKTWNKRLYEQISFWAFEKFDGNRFRQDVQYVADRSINARPPGFGKCKGDDDTVRFHPDDFLVHVAGNGGSKARKENISKWEIVEQYLNTADAHYKYSYK